MSKRFRTFSRRRFIKLASTALAGSLIVADRFPSLLLPPIREVSAAAPGISDIFRVLNCPPPANGRHAGLQNLFTLMGSNGLKLLRSSSTGSIWGPDGLISANDVVLIKINCQWEERGGTNTDLVRELIHTLTSHPDGFTGEIVVADNGQWRGSFTWPNANAENTSQNIQSVVNYFATQGFKVSTFLWDNIREARRQEYDQNDNFDGYVMENNSDPTTGMKFNYPKFKTSFGTYISLKKGIWDPTSRTYLNQRLKLINFPVLKSHDGAGVTACIKHYMGVVSQGMQDNHPYISNGGLAAEMAAIRYPTLNILDAIYVNPHPKESGRAGPYTLYSSALKTNQIMASLDPVALDYWGAKNVLMPAAKSLGYTSYSSLDPDTSGGVFHNYLVNSMNVLVAAGKQATMDPSKIRVLMNEPRVWVSGTYLGLVELENYWSSGPSGDQQSTSVTFTPTSESVTLEAVEGETFLLLGTAQLWNRRSDVGSSLAIFKGNNQRLSGDMFTLGSAPTHRHAAMAIAVVTPGAGTHNFTLRFKTDPGGTAWISGTHLLAVKFSTPPISSGPHGDQSTNSTSFTPTAESVVLTTADGESLLLIGSAQLWNDNSGIGSSIAISRDGTRISGDIFSIGVTSRHRTIATAIAVDTPTGGDHTYSLNFKTDPSGRAWVSGTYLIAVKVPSAYSSGPGGDQSSIEKNFTSTAQTLQLSNPENKKYLAVASGQLWGDDASIGQSLCITRDNSRISADMFTLGTRADHRHIAAALGVDSPGTGTYNYAVAFKTD